jgi:RNA-directed DNA polymerase
MLSNLVMREADQEIEIIAKRAGLRYTRYSDDLTFSTSDDFDRRSATRLTWDISDVLRRMGLLVNKRKTQIVPPGGRKIVLGLLVNGAHPRLTKDFRSILRQHLFYLEKVGPLEHAKSREFDTVAGMHNHVRGLIDFAKMIDPTFAGGMLDRFNNVRWVV